jgi:putative membrane protein
MDISAQDRQRVGAAIRDAEGGTSSEIVCVVARTSSDATALPILIAAIAALALPWLLMAFTTMSVTRMLLLQVLLFLVLAFVLCLPRVRVALMPRSARRAVAHRVAMEQFVIRGLARKKDGAGILIFVSLAERYARIIAGEGVAVRVPRAEWQHAVDGLVAHVREGRLVDGLVTAVDICGNILAVHCPRTEPANGTLPDRLYVI